MKGTDTEQTLKRLLGIPPNVECNAHRMGLELREYFRVNPDVLQIFSTVSGLPRLHEVITLFVDMAYPEVAPKQPLDYDPERFPTKNQNQT